MEQEVIAKLKEDLAAAYGEIRELKNDMSCLFVKVDWPESQDWMDNEEAYAAMSDDDNDEPMVYFVPYWEYVGQSDE
jgi:hypothetical protein